MNTESVTCTLPSTAGMSRSTRRAYRPPRGDEQQEEMVQSIDNDNQESARLLQEMMEETSGGS